MFFILILFSANGWSALHCRHVFKAVQKNHRGVKVTEVFSDFIAVEKSSQRQMFLKIERPSEQAPQKWLFLIHGLMDSHVGWNSVARLALKQGYGVIRVDLNGHGRTLDKSVQQNQPTSLDYKVNVQDVIHVLELLKTNFGIQKPYLAGHSYGGGIATAVAGHSQAQNLISPAVFLLAPYVYRLDAYHAEKSIDNMTGGQALVDMMKSTIPLSPFKQMAESALDQIPTGQTFLDIFKKAVPDSAQKTLESITTDLSADAFMSKAYRDHYTHQLEQRLPSFRADNIEKIEDPTQRQKKWDEKEEIIARHVIAAIEITKGIRSFDAREAAADLPPEFSIRLILAEKDALLPEALQKEFFGQITKVSKDGELIIVPEAGHMVINERPQEVFGIIHEVLSNH